MAIKRPVTKKPTADEADESKKKVLTKKAAEPEPEPEPDDEPEPTSKKGLVKKGKSASFADIFNSTKPATGKVDFPLGEFRAKVIELSLDGEIDDGEQESDLSVTIKYEGLEDEAEGKTINSRYTLFKDGEPNEGGIGVFKKDTDALGYEDISLEDIEELCTTVTNEEPEVVIKTVDKKGYINAYLQGLAE